jgi:DNA-binding GntR family transcriptional regulator
MSDTSAPTRVVTGAEGRNVAEGRLRDEISRGELVPGQRLVESELADRYGVTRNSVRLALDALVAEGLVERIRNRGARVRTLTTADAVGIIECRAVLDGLLSRKAAEQGTDDELSALALNLTRMEEAVSAMELLSYLALIQQHHALIQAAAKQPVAADIVQSLQGRFARHQFRLSLRPERAQQSLEELREVVRALLERDGDAAEERARAHFRGVIAGILREAGVA